VAAPGIAPASGRLKAIDVFRGAAIVGMILVNAQGSREDAYSQFVHAAWNGLTFADTIYPCFLFLVGVALTLSTASRINRGEERGQLLLHAVRRSVLLLACGVLIDNLLFPYRQFPFFAFRDHLQLTGVLQRIALCYLAAFLIYLHGGRRAVILGAVAVNLAYLGLLFFYVVPGCGAGALSPDCNFPGYLDHTMIGRHLWNSPAHDPDGFGALLPGIGTVLLGVIAGEFLWSEVRPQRRIVGLLAGAIGLMAAGALSARWVPINKALWTPSYEFLTGGLAAAFLAGWIWVVDVREWGRGFKVLQIFGVNAVAAYLLSVLAANVLLVHVMGASIYTDILARFTSPPNASLLYAIVVAVLVYAAVWFMGRRGWYLKF
jgi:predicted acyltransferase